MQSDLVITGMTELDEKSNWHNVITDLEKKHNVKIESAVFADYGMADRCVAMLTFSDIKPTCEVFKTFIHVGAGEVMRPYDTIYEGYSASDATQAFLNDFRPQPHSFIMRCTKCNSDLVVNEDSQRLVHNKSDGTFDIDTSGMMCECDGDDSEYGNHWETMPSNWV